MINLKKRSKTIIGMVHIQALPGTPNHHLPITEIIDKALTEAEILEKKGVDAIMIENMHDIPYLNRDVGPEITAGMCAVAYALRQNTSLDIGIQVLAGANKNALAIAQACSMQFIRAEAFVFGHLADEGYMDSCAGELLRYRKTIGAENIAILTDIKKKHSSHQISLDVGLGETIKAANFFQSDGIIITGSATGEAVNQHDLTQAQKSTQLPVIIGSGVTTNNIDEVWEAGDAFIIGSWFKKNHYWKNDVDENHIASLIQKVNILRTNSNS